MSNLAAQFRQIDRPSQLQEPSIRFEREILIDEAPDLSWLTQDYESESAKDRTKYKAQDKRRLAAYNRGEWCMTGVRVVAHIEVPIGGDSFRSYTLASGGIWGIESDADETYLKTIEADERDSLISDFKAMGAAFAALGA